MFGKSRFQILARRQAILTKVFRGFPMSLLALMMEAEGTSETSDNFNVTTRRYISEDSKRLYNYCFRYPQRIELKVWCSSKYGVKFPVLLSSS
jgi:hypothetical protein